MNKTPLVLLAAAAFFAVFLAFVSHEAALVFVTGWLLAIVTAAELIKGSKETESN